MTLLYVLTLFPLVPALCMLLIKNEDTRSIVSLVGAAIIMALSLIVTVQFFATGPQTFALSASVSTVLSYVSAGVDILLCAVIIYNAVRYKNLTTFILAVVQLVGIVAFSCMTLGGGEEPLAEPLYIDHMSVIMILIIGIVGSLICVYANGYMKDFQRHDEHEAALKGQTAPDKRPGFQALMYLFLSAMFVIVISDNLDWLFCAWEVTTVCSYLMIGYTKTPEAIKNSFLQIILNMIGGICFLAALVIMHLAGVELSLTEMVAVAQGGGVEAQILIFPTMLLSMAAFTKAAQMPFHKWLLGAMVAPTPTSALLHSSTMVKAGVFLVVKLAPLYMVYPGAAQMTTAVGAVTFLLAALCAISQTNAKRVLAYSTISNLGLITACLGVAAPEAMWAGILLIIFHTVAKSLLFLCVGTAEHHIGSRDIEEMDALFSRMPRLARCMMLGIMGMFVAPFGMLVSKWGALVSFAQTGNVLMIMVLAFGSAATFFFWSKWLAKLSGVDPLAQNVESGELRVHRTEWIAIFTIAGLLVVCCVGLAALSSFVSIYLGSVFGEVPTVIGRDSMFLMIVIVAFTAIVMLTSFRVSNKPKVTTYLSGVNVDDGHRMFLNSFGCPMRASKRNWYLESVFGDARIGNIGIVINLAIIVFTFFYSYWADPSTLATGLETVSRPDYFEGGSLLGVLVGTVVFAVVGTILGGFIEGVDRKISARMQGRIGPRIFQPYYDVIKLFQKEDGSVNAVDDTYVACSLIFVFVAGGLFISGGNLMLCSFLVTLSTMFTVLAAASTLSPFAQTGADRELLQVMSYEPTVLLMSVGLYLTNSSFDTMSVTHAAQPLILNCWPIFLALCAVLTIKLHKSPFDISYSHHAHQEIVQGMVTEMSGTTLAKIDIMHWCESVLFLMWVGMYFVDENPLSWLVAIVVAVVVYFIEILIDNTFARSTWRSCLKLGWSVAVVAGLINLMPIMLDALL